MPEHKLFHVEPDALNRIQDSSSFKDLQKLLSEGWNVVNMIPQKVAAGGEFHSYAVGGYMVLLEKS